MNQKYLKSILDYDKNTGIFTWKKPLGMKMKKGQIAGQDCHGYRAIRINKKLHLSHRLAWLYVYGKNPRKVVDHINGIKDDNRIENLRDVSQLINMQNTLKPHKNNKTGAMGVTWDKNKWVARIRTLKGRIQVGRFTSLLKAKKAYLTAKKIYHFQ